jgi:DNA-binding response OmpR family regulator
MRLLLVEDDGELAAVTAEALRPSGFAVDTVKGMEDAESALLCTAYDAVILDLGLPDGDGLTLLRAMRARRNATPVLILTARDQLDDRVAGLDQGADDYMLKPFEVPELAARLRALLRRPGGALGVTLTFGDISFDTVTRELSVDGRAVALTRREADALEQLLRRAGRVVPKEVIDRSIYAAGEEVQPNTVEVLISRLRRRLQNSQARAAIHTVRGIGYLLIEARA